MELLLGFNTEVLHNSYNVCTRVLPDMCTVHPLGLQPLGLGCSYIPGRPLVSVLQLLSILQSEVHLLHKGIIMRQGNWDRASTDTKSKILTLENTKDSGMR